MRVTLTLARRTPAPSPRSAPAGRRNACPRPSHTLSTEQRQKNVCLAEWQITARVKQQLEVWGHVLLKYIKCEIRKCNKLKGVLVLMNMMVTVTDGFWLGYINEWLLYHGRRPSGRHLCRRRCGRGRDRDADRHQLPVAEAPLVLWTIPHVMRVVGRRAGRHAGQEKRIVRRQTSARALPREDGKQDKDVSCNSNAARVKPKPKEGQIKTQNIKKRRNNDTVASGDCVAAPREGARAMTGLPLHAASQQNKQNHRLWLAIH